MKAHNGLAGNERADGRSSYGGSKGEDRQVAEAGVKQWRKARRKAERKLKRIGSRVVWHTPITGHGGGILLQVLSWICDRRGGGDIFAFPL